MSVLFELLLRLYPRELRDRYADDMRELFRDQRRAARGPRARLRLLLRTLTAVPAAALLAHRDTLRDRTYPTQHPTDRARNRNMIESLRQDLRFALRSLRKSPVFTIVAVAAIALGAGAVTTIFSAMNALVIRPLPGTSGGSRIVGIQLSMRDGRTEMNATLALYDRIREHSRTLASVAAAARTTFTVAASGAGAVVTSNFASTNYFSVLGLRPTLGRFFLASENEAPVVVVSHAFWSTHLGADTSLVGKTISVNGQAYTLIGVGPEGFRGTIALLSVDAWAPLAMQATLSPGRNLLTARWLRMFGRLESDATIESAQAEVTTIVAANSIAQPTKNAAREAGGARVALLRAIPEDARGDFLGFMSLLLGAAALVLLIASVNVASLLSARAIARRREMAVRAALGAGRPRLVAQLLTEILVLFVFGAAGGLAFAFAATRAASAATFPIDIIVPPDMTPDLRVMLFALLVSLATGVIFGLAPALRASRDDITAPLRDGSAAAGSRRGMVGDAMIIGQLALSLVLLVTAGLFMRALTISARVDAGFDRANLAIASFESQSWGYDSVRARRFYAALAERVSAIPGVSDVAFASFAPLTTRSMNDSLTIRGDEKRFTWLTNVGGDYFGTLRMPIVAGRALSASDDDTRSPVAVVNETFARRLSNDGNVLGHTVMRRGKTVTIVGIAKDAKYANLSEATPPMIYFPMLQAWQPHQTILIRGSVTIPHLTTGIRAAMREIDPAVPAPAVVTLERASGITVLTQRIAAIVTGTLGGIGLLLATLGLYGIIAYSVNRRTREIGLRIALGARPADVQRLVVREGMRLAFGGVALGLLLSAAATRLIAGFLFDVSALDAVTFASMSLLFVGVALVASYLPARRAAGSDPMTALRSE
jgi:predicted permease